MVDIVHVRDGLQATRRNARHPPKQTLRPNVPAPSRHAPMLARWCCTGRRRSHSRSASSPEFVSRLTRYPRRSPVAFADPAAGRDMDLPFLAGLTLFFCAAAYLIYMRRAGLFSRNALKKTRVMVMPVASKMRFGGLNVLLHWAAYVIVLTMTVTGVIPLPRPWRLVGAVALLRGIHRARLHLHPHRCALSAMAAGGSSFACSAPRSW